MLSTLPSSQSLSQPQFSKNTLLRAGALRHLTNTPETTDRNRNKLTLPEDSASGNTFTVTLLGKFVFEYSLPGSPPERTEPLINGILRVANLAEDLQVQRAALPLIPEDRWSINSGRISVNAFSPGSLVEDIQDVIDIGALYLDKLAGAEDSPNVPPTLYASTQPLSHPVLELALDSIGDATVDALQSLGDDIHTASWSNPRSLTDALLKLSTQESGANPSTVNHWGFSGLFQIGAEGLEDAGYLKPGTAAKVYSEVEGEPHKVNQWEKLDSENDFTEKANSKGITSFNDILTKPAAQLDIIKSLMKINIDRLNEQFGNIDTFNGRNVRFTGTYDGEPRDETVQLSTFGIVAAAHLRGSEAVRRVLDIVQRTPDDTLPVVEMQAGDFDETGVGMYQYIKNFEVPEVSTSDFDDSSALHDSVCRMAILPNTTPTTESFSTTTTITESGPKIQIHLSDTPLATLTPEPGIEHAFFTEESLQYLFTEAKSRASELADKTPLPVKTLNIPLTLSDGPKEGTLAVNTEAMSKQDLFELIEIIKAANYDIDTNVILTEAEKCPEGTSSDDSPGKNATNSTLLWGLVGGAAGTLALCGAAVYSTLSCSTRSKAGVSSSDVYRVTSPIAASRAPIVSRDTGRSSGLDDTPTPTPTPTEASALGLSEINVEMTETLPGAIAESQTDSNAELDAV